MRPRFRLRVENTEVSLRRMAPSAARLTAVLLLAGACAAGRCVADTAERVIQYDGDRLTVRLNAVPLSDVINELGRQAGAEIQGGLRSPHDVSAEFEKVPLPEALHRLLGEQNFALVYGEGGRLRTVKLLGGPLGPPAPAVAAAPQAPPTTVPVKSYDTAGALINAIVAHPPVPIDGRLADALGTQSATVQQIVEASLHNDDASIRSEGVRRILALIEAEPDLRGSVLGTVKGMDDGDLAGMLKSASPGHAEEIAVHIATQSHVSELRVKASGILQQLRAPKAGG